MYVFLRAKALKTENVNFFLYHNVALVVISFRTVFDCMWFDTYWLYYITLALWALFLHVEASCARHLTAIHIVVFVIACVEFLKKRGKKPCACNTTEV